ncbi:alcohol oxidase [Hysterangium stoloniferum]|nr:alcohol oxidase [Hysterangium stoloniferum]
MSKFSSISFDYLIVGGGLAGLVLASRLSEDPQISVGVIEAGGHTSSIPDILIPVYHKDRQEGRSFTCQGSVIPELLVGKSRFMFGDRGKGLGGSSLINSMVLTRGSAGDYNAFEELGNEGWNWPKFLHYFRKSETFTPPPISSTTAHHLDIHMDPEYHGTCGPLSKTLPRWFSDMQLPFINALDSLGIPFNPDANKGFNIGTTSSPVCIHPDTVTRSFSTSKSTRAMSRQAYYDPVKTRSNLHVITNAQALRVLFAARSQNKALASGVEYTAEGELWIAKANKEVILCAGAFQTPQLLELSGDPVVLTRAGVKSRIPLLGVGNNLQDHPWVPVVFETTPDYESLEVLTEPNTYAKYFSRYESEKRGVLSSVNSAFAFLPLKEVMDDTSIEDIKRVATRKCDMIYNNRDKRQYGYAVQLDMQAARMSDPLSAQIMLSPAPSFFIPPGLDVPGAVPNTSYLTLLTTQLHPLSRGSVHIESANPLIKPVIDPALFSHSLDLDILVSGVKYARSVASTESMRHVVGREVYPGPEAQSEAELARFVKTFAGCLFHPVGTAKMGREEEQGVVNSKLIVHGTVNLRVIGAHIQSTVYAIAEKVIIFTPSVKYSRSSFIIPIRPPI